MLSLVSQLSRELHPSSGFAPEPSPTSVLDGDLGLDSLVRLELLTRLETRFDGCVEAEEVILADTVADVIRAVTPAADRAPSASTGRPRAVALLAPERSGLRSIPEILVRLVERDPGFVCVRLLAGGDTVEEVAAGDLLRGARQVAAGLARRIEVGEPVGLMLPTGRDFLEALFGIQMAGGIAVPLAPAARPSQIEDHLLRQVQIIDDCRAGVLIAGGEVAALARLLRLRARTVRRVVSVEQLRADRTGVVPWRSRDDAPALLQYTSGSTGAPKGVVLSHRNLLSNLEAIALALETGSQDVFVSWLPLYHDMGLIGGLLHPLYCGIPLILMSPLAFLARPELWVETIDRFRGSMTVAPNFAYEICQRRAAESALGQLDLSGWRLALNGAEPVSPATIDRFCERFGPYGFRRSAMLPVYGLAENSLAVTFPALGVGAKIDRVRREPLLTRGQAEEAGETEEALSFVSCGRPIHQVELRLVDRAGHEVPERQVGRVQFRGSSATSGYYRDEAATRELFDRGWIESGDLGYRAAGDLYLTGRSKDIIIHAGRNLSPHALEEAAGDLEGIRKGCVAVFGVADADLGTERLVIVAETRERDRRRQRDLVAAVNAACLKLIGVVPDDVCLVSPHLLLKTSSGKIRRAACRDLYVSGRLAESRRGAAWRQMAAVLTGAAAAATSRGWRGVPTAIYSLYLWVLAALLLTTVWLGALLLPRRAWCMGMARLGCRAFFTLAGLSLRVNGLENLATDRQGRGIVMVSNHASYVDPMILLATMPGDLSFVAKREFAANPVTRLLMRRLGVAFVDSSGAGDARREMSHMAAKVESGEALAVFAEGTFVHSAGLRAFRLGAFEVASRAGRPIVPVVIRGSRELLRDGQWSFRRVPLEITVCEPIMAAGGGFGEAVRLRDLARAGMLAHLDEPDLLESHEATNVLAEGMR